MEKIIQAQWQNWEGDATENLTLRENKEGSFVKSTVKSRGKVRFTANYTITCDTLWRVRTITIELHEKKTKLELISDGLGNWSNGSGAIPKLKGAIDADISVTPFTNTLPIRRLKLTEGQSAEITVVYITMPALDVSLDSQRYTCIIPNKRYRYESLDSDFAREIEVDSYGLVLQYPDLFKRIR